MSEQKDFKIIYVTHYTELYGANRSLLNLIEGLLSFNFRDILVLIPGKGKICEELNKLNVSYAIIPFVNETFFLNQKHGIIKKAGKFIYNWFVVLKYATKLRSNKKTIVHSNSSATFIGAYFAWLLKVSHVWHIREFGLEDYKFKYNFGYKFFQFWLNRSAACIAISKAIYEKRLKETKTVIKRVIYNGVVTIPDLEKRKKLMTLKSKDNRIKKFGIIGHISPEKGQADAIEALRLLSETQKNILLTVAGTGDEEYIKKIHEKINSNNLEDKIIFLGYLEDPDLFYQSIDCLLMCSKNEGLGRVTLEAMSYGVPVIGFNNAGTAEIIEHGKNGLLYSNGPEDLCLMMCKFIEQDSLVPDMGQNAWQSVKEKFTVESCAKAVSEIYMAI